MSNPGRALGADRQSRSVSARPLPGGRTTRVLHWGVAGLLAGSFLTAWVSGAFNPGAVAAGLVEVHRSIGLVVLALMIARVAWRVGHPLPELPVTTALWEVRLAKAVQFALYACLLAMPLLGWLGSDARGDAVVVFGAVPLPSLIEPTRDNGDLLFGVHATLGFAILGLLSLHVAGALRHHFIKGDHVLRRMISDTGA